MILFLLNLKIAKNNPINIPIIKENIVNSIVKIEALNNLGIFSISMFINE
tara:strand:- start:910 stop:1059 length:150 start_codon:yes stop_codon:yes gene_type:complete